MMDKRNNLPEAVRNRLLRRVDWRFLLPNPTPARSICFAEGLLAEAVMLISQETLPPTQLGESVCDLAVAVNPNATVLQAAWQALRPGGVCYMEWYRPVLGGVSAVRRRFTQAGFSEIACYWPWPWPTHANPLFWLPLESPAALAYFLDNRPIASGGRRRWQTLSRQIWQVGVKLHLVLPIGVVAHKPLEASATHGSELSFVSEKSSDPCVALSARLLLTGGLRSINKVVEQRFVGQEREPRQVVKYARVAESIPALAREAAVLQAIHSGRTPAMTGVPQVLFTRRTENDMAVGESAVAGVPIWTQMNQGNYRHLAWQATEWLVALAGDAAPQAPERWRERLVDTVLMEFQQNFGPVLEASQVQIARTVLEELGPLRLICEHRDFSPWNVLLTKQGTLAVLDWESAELQGLPALDLIYFLAYLTFFLDGAMESQRFVASYWAMLQPSTPTGVVFQACMAYYARQLGLDLNCLQGLRLLVWMIHARSEYQRLCAEAGGTAPAALLRRSLFVALWQEEVQHLSANRNQSLTADCAD